MDGELVDGGDDVRGTAALLTNSVIEAFPRQTLSWIQQKKTICQGIVSAYDSEQVV